MSPSIAKIWIQPPYFKMLLLFKLTYNHHSHKLKPPRNSFIECHISHVLALINSEAVIGIVLIVNGFVIELHFGNGVCLLVDWLKVA